MENKTARIQSTCLLILKETVRICEKYNISYYLVGGTALGAYRHKGFIPWDDDIDIGIPRKDYDKFLEYCKIELNSQFYLQDFTVNNEMITPYAKIRLKNTAFVEQSISHLNIHHGIFIDIFPLDNIPNNSLMRTYQKYGVKLSNFIRYSKLKFPAENNIKRILYKVTDLVVPKSLYPKLYSHFLKISVNKDTNKIGNLLGFYPYEKEAMDKSIFGEGTYLVFEHTEFRVPSNIVEFLTQIYGENFMELPPIEKRRTHLPMYLSFEEEFVPKGDESN